MESLLQPANRAAFTKVLNDHVVSGKVLAKDFVAQIQNGGGEAVLTKLEGGTLTARLEGSSVVITDELGERATVTATDLQSGNDVVHVTDAVFMPT